MTLHCCERCGVALTPGLGGPARKLSLVADNGHMTTAILCGEHYGEAVRGALEALLGETYMGQVQRV